MGVQHSRDRALTRETVIKIAGPMDDDLVMRIIDSGASEAELVEALTWMSGDEEATAVALGHEQHSRVAMLCEILSTSVTEEDER